MPGTNLDTGPQSAGEYEYCKSGKWYGPKAADNNKHSLQSFVEKPDELVHLWKWQQKRIYEWVCQHEALSDDIGPEEINFVEKMDLYGSDTALLDFIWPWPLHVERTPADTQHFTRVLRSWAKNQSVNMARFIANGALDVLKYRDPRSISSARFASVSSEAEEELVNLRTPSIGVITTGTTAGASIPGAEAGRRQRDDLATETPDSSQQQNATDDYTRRAREQPAQINDVPISDVKERRMQQFQALAAPSHSPQGTDPYNGSGARISAIWQTEGIAANQVAPNEVATTSATASDSQDQEPILWQKRAQIATNTAGPVPAWVGLSAPQPSFSPAPHSTAQHPSAAFPPLGLKYHQQTLDPIPTYQTLRPSGPSQPCQHPSQSYQQINQKQHPNQSYQQNNRNQHPNQSYQPDNEIQHSNQSYQQKNRNQQLDQPYHTFSPQHQQHIHHHQLHQPYYQQPTPKYVQQNHPQYQQQSPTAKPTKPSYNMQSSSSAPQTNVPLSYAFPPSSPPQMLANQRFRLQSQSLPRMGQHTSVQQASLPPVTLDEMLANLNIGKG